MSILNCPVCNKTLSLDEKSYKCSNNHCFDLSKFGVLNLSLNNKSSKKRHGDDKAMVIARKEFLEKGYYDPIKADVISLCKKHCKNAKSFIDAGCGEGYYTAFVVKELNPDEVYGVDLSKEALRYFKKRIFSALPIVASIFKMPFENASTDLVLSMFAPAAYDEFLRVLKKDGIFIKTKVLKNHLIELKQAVYDNPYYNDDEPDEIDGFEKIDEIITDYKTDILGDDIKKLFLMTPYYYKTGKTDQKKLDFIEKLNVNISVKTVVYKKV